MIDHSVKAVNFYLSIILRVTWFFFCHHGMTQLWFTSINKVGSCERIVLAVGRQRGGWSFSSVAKLRNKTWWKVTKCYTEFYIHVTVHRNRFIFK